MDRVQDRLHLGKPQGGNEKIDRRDWHALMKSKICIAADVEIAPAIKNPRKIAPNKFLCVLVKPSRLRPFMTDVAKKLHGGVARNQQLRIAV